MIKSKYENVPYVFFRGQRCIYAEVLFPRKSEYQGAIFSALNEGLIESQVRAYLTTNIIDLLQEMQYYLYLFDPLQYERTKALASLEIRPEQAEKRIAKYRSHFYG